MATLMRSPLDRPRRVKTPPFVMVFCAEMAQVLERNLVRGQTLRVLCYVIMRCAWGNWVEMSHREIAEALGCYPEVISRSMAQLVRLGLVLRNPPLRGRQWVYRIPSTLAQHGSAANLGWQRQRDLTQQQKQRQTPSDA